MSHITHSALVHNLSITKYDTIFMNIHIFSFETDNKLYYAMYNAMN